MKLAWTLTKRVLPFVVSGVLLTFLLSRIGVEAAVEHVTVDVARALIPPLLLFMMVSWWLEARSLGQLIPGRVLSLWTCARIKAATYPLAMAHYTLGVGTLTVVLARRAGMAIADAAGLVLLVSAFDLGILLVLAGAGAAMLSTEAPVVRASVLAVAGTGIVLGFVLLRAPGPLGPFEFVRSLELFRRLRTAPSSLLAELAVLRMLFVVSFIWILWMTLRAFGVSVPLGDLVVNVAALSLVAALPIAVAGLGTGQVAFVYLFRHWAPADTLLACSLTFSVAFILMRSGIGLLFARDLVSGTSDP